MLHMPLYSLTDDMTTCTVEADKLFPFEEHHGSFRKTFRAETVE